MFAGHTVLHQVLMLFDFVCQVVHFEVTLGEELAIHLEDWEAMLIYIKSYILRITYFSWMATCR